jgi:divalent metal cation (Fe/Co/Zn/Cd) transporter
VAAYKSRVGNRIQSATLLADARHSWLDALSSLGALVGLVGVALGASWADPLAGFAVTAFMVHVGWQVSTDLAHHMMDGVDPQVLSAAVDAARMVPDVLDATARGRWTGRTLRIETDVTLDSALPLADASHIADAVRLATLQHVAAARLVTVRPCTNLAHGERRHDCPPA